MCVIAGLTLFSLTNTQPAFGRDNLAALPLVTDGDFIGIPTGVDGYSDCVRDVLSGLLRVESGDRTSASEAIRMIEAARAHAESVEQQRLQQNQLQMARRREVEQENAHVRPIPSVIVCPQANAIKFFGCILARRS